MRKILITGAAALALGAVPVLAPAAAAQELPTTVSIQVVLDLDGNPRVFAVTDVPVGAGPELTEADETSNPQGWCGYLDVDVDNVAQTITITGGDDCYFETASVTIEGEGIESLTVLADGAIEPLGECDLVSTAGVTSPGVAQFDWSAPCDIIIVVGGVSSYSYAASGPTTSTTAAPTTTTTTTTAPAAAAAATVTPAFTG